MIISGLIYLAYFLVNGVISALPDSSGFPTAAHTAVQSLGGYVGMFSPILPMATLATCIGLIFTVEIAIFGLKTFKWIVAHIPWVGGKGV